MKFLLCLILVAHVPLFAAAAKPSAAASPPPLLQVEVLVPPTGDMLYEDEIERVFVDSARETFRRRNYPGEIEEVRLPDDVRADATLVTVRLIRWQRTRTGGVECTFGASVRPPGGEEKSLGLFTSTESPLGITSRWSLGEAFLAAAEDAADDLWRRASREGLLPGLAPSRR